MTVTSLETSKKIFECSGSEEWKTIEGLPSYEISSHGRIRHVVRKKIRKLGSNSDGYTHWSVKIGSRITTLYVHRMVAKHFVPGGGGDKVQVNHLDSNPAHNCAHNLEWCTPAENVEHSRTHGKADRYQNRGEKHGMHKLTEVDVQLIRNLKGESSGVFVADLFRVSPQAVYDIWNGRRWKHVS